MEVVLRRAVPRTSFSPPCAERSPRFPAQVSFGQPISHRIDHMISAASRTSRSRSSDPTSRAAQSRGGRREDPARRPGIADLGNTEQASVRSFSSNSTAAMARFGVSATSLARTVEALFQGSEVGRSWRRDSCPGGRPLPEALRRERDRLDDLPVAMSDGVSFA